MRDNDLNDRKTDIADTAVIRRVRSVQRIRVESGDTIRFNVAAFELDRELGIAEHLAVERNLRVVSAWPEVLFL